MEHSAQKKERKKIEENVTIAPIWYIIATGSQCIQRNPKKQKKKKKTKIPPKPKSTHNTKKNPTQEKVESPMER